jgi:transcription initiation factor TFIIIB Brf1 subunit/transcription initiation factor TFIIB
MTTPEVEKYYVEFHEFEKGSNRIPVVTTLRDVLQCSLYEAKKYLDSLPIRFDVSNQYEAQEIYNKFVAKDVIVSARTSYYVIESNSEIIRRRENVPIVLERIINTFQTSDGYTQEWLIPNYVNLITTKKDFNPNQNEVEMSIYVNKAVDGRDKSRFMVDILIKYIEFLTEAGILGLQLKCKFVEGDESDLNYERELWIKS